MTHQQDTGAMLQTTQLGMRGPLDLDDMLAPRPGTRLLAIDDDPVFLKMLAQAAKVVGIEIDTYATSGDCKRALLANPNRHYQAAIIDFQLGRHDYGDHLSAWLKQWSPDELPVVLVSQNSVKLSAAVNPGIKEFIPKDCGVLAIVDAALEAAEIEHLHQRMRWQS